jgi:hypothetical protein
MNEDRDKAVEANISRVMALSEHLALELALEVKLIATIGGELTAKKIADKIMFSATETNISFADDDDSLIRFVSYHKYFNTKYYQETGGCA